MATWTQADLDAAKTALLTAVSTGKSVRFGEREYTSHNLVDLRALIADMERAVGASPSSRLAAFSKGV